LSETFWSKNAKFGTENFDLGKVFGNSLNTCNFFLLEIWAVCWNSVGNLQCLQCGKIAAFLSR